MTATHLLIDTGRASSLTACDEPFSNGQPGTDDFLKVTCEACRAMFPNAPKTAFGPHQPRDLDREGFCKTCGFLPEDGRAEHESTPLEYRLDDGRLCCAECSTPVGQRHGWGCDSVLHGDVALEQGPEGPLPPKVVYADCTDEEF